MSKKGKSCICSLNGIKGLKILQSLECVEHLCAALWCRVTATLPRWPETSLWQGDCWASRRSDWLQISRNRPSGKPEREEEGRPQRSLELDKNKNLKKNPPQEQISKSLTDLHVLPVCVEQCCEGEETWLQGVVFSLNETSHSRKQIKAPENVAIM